MSHSIRLNPHTLQNIAAAHQLTEHDMAARIGVTTQQYQSALAGNPVPVAFVAKTALAFGTSFHELFHTEDTPAA